MLSESRFVLRVPVDAARVPDFTLGRRVSVLAWNRLGCTQQRVVTFDRNGKAVASFEFDREPESLRVALGPETATPADLQHLQTISTTVPSSAWRTSRAVELPAMQVSTWDWWWWQHWRQSFRVTGRVVDVQGRPIVGANVSALDVDAWWWWTAQEQVGSTVTDSEGTFLIEFTRCCGWWPWWWWVTRQWQVDAALAERITSFVRQYPGLDLLPTTAESAPSFALFQPLLATSSRPASSALRAALSQSGKTIDPVSIEDVREWLVEILPRRFPLPVWPWSEWSPWEDCGANLIFHVTEAKGPQTVVLVHETVADARWDIPASLDVKLMAHASTQRESMAHWTLVDYLFPQHHPAARPENKNDRTPALLPRSQRGATPQSRPRA
jgi:hypothetical protein